MPDPKQEMRNLLSGTQQEKPDESQLRDPGDYQAMRREIFNKAEQAVKNMEPVSNRKYTLKVKDVDWKKDPEYDTRDIINATRQGDTLSRGLTGKFSLIDNDTGEEVQETGRKNLMNVPYFTDDGTFVLDGTEMGFTKQLRLSPGVYTQKKNDGTPEAKFNVGKGGGFRMNMNPSTGVFYLRSGNKHIPAYHVFRSMGVPDEELKKRWGDLYKANSSKKLNRSHEQWIQEQARKGWNLINKENHPKDENLSDTANGLRAWFSSKTLDPEKTNETLGMEIDRVTPEAMLRATNNIREVHNNEHPSDNLDSLRYQNVLDFPDRLEENIQRDRTGGMRRLLWDVTRKNDIGAIPASPMDTYVSDLFLNSGNQQVLEQTNPLDSLNQANKLSKLGEGGMPSTDMATTSSRGVHGSYLGFIDPARTPECYSSDTEVMTEDGWKAWPDVTYEDKFACLIGGRLEYHYPEALQKYYLEDYLYGAETKTISYLVTKNHRMFVRPDGRNHSLQNYRFEYAKDIHDCCLRFVMSGGFDYPINENPKMTFYIPSVEKNASKNGGGNNIKNHTHPIPMDIWSRFLGWYIAEGSYYYKNNGKKVSYVTRITQSKKAHPEYCSEIEDVLDKLPFSFSYNDSYNIPVKQITDYVSQFGKSYEKRLPSDIFETSVDNKFRFIDSLLKGDGTSDKKDGKLNLFTTSNWYLASDLQELLFSLGISSIIKQTRPVSGNWRAEWVVRLYDRNEKIIKPKRSNCPETQYFTKYYRGYVYCATVPGSLLYVRRNNKCGFWCGNSLRVGLDTYLADGVKMGPDRKLYKSMINPKTDEREWVDSQTAARSTVGFPSYKGKDKDKKYVDAVKGDEFSIVPREEVDYILPDSDEMNNAFSKTIPMESGVKGMRKLMAAKFARHALPLSQPEAPKVTTRSEGGKPIEKQLGSKAGAQYSPADGTVEEVSQDKITVRDGKGNQHKVPIYYHRPYSRKSGNQSYPKVQQGDKVREGDLLSTSDYTDEQGNWAVTRNLRTAILPAKGLNYEDANSISQSAAKKLQAKLMMSPEFKTDDEHILSKKEFMKSFPGRYSPEQLDKINEDGTLKVGAEVEYGDPIFLAVRNRKPTETTLNRPLQTDASQTWDHKYRGMGVRSSSKEDGHIVDIETEFPTEEGDKISIPFGSKGVSAKIRPDERMPRDAQGRPVDVLLNSLSVSSRANPSQIPAMQLGKIAEKTGGKYVLPGTFEETGEDPSE